MTAESGNIALSVDEGQWQRRCYSPQLTRLWWDMEAEPGLELRISAFGNRLVEYQLKAVRASVEKEGELTEAAIRAVMFQSKPSRLTQELENLRSQLQQNPEDLEAAALRAKQKEQALAFLDRKLRLISRANSRCEELESKAEETRQAAAVLPSMELLERILVARRSWSGGCIAPWPGWNGCNECDRASPYHRR